jgi:hypothetical protein
MYSSTVIRRWDEEQVSWASQRLGGAAFGRRGFIEPTHIDFEALGVKSYWTTEHVGNVIVNVGWTRLMNLLTNQGATQAYDATHTRIGVGIGVTAAAATDTDLSASTGSTNRQWKLVSGAGTLGTRTLAWSASFASAEGNFHWQEWGVDNGTADGTGASTAPLLNHAVSDQSTKVSGQVWTPTVTFTFT